MRACTSGRRSGGTVLGGWRRAGSAAKRRVVVAVTSATAVSKASTLASVGRVMPLTLRTYWRAAASISTAVAGGSSPRSSVMFRHMGTNVGAQDPVASVTVMSADPVLLIETADRVRTLTLNRPQGPQRAVGRTAARGSLARWPTRRPTTTVDVVIVTGADPVFCAGLDLKELGNTTELPDISPKWPAMRKPVIGAINGAAVTGGLELALYCDVLIASENARFADTHARVGLLPTWGLSVRLPQKVGIGMARRMSLTGDYLSAHDALRCGLVTEVVAHEDLLPAARRIAASIVGNNQKAVRALLDSYHRIDEWPPTPHCGSRPSRPGSGCGTPAATTSLPAGPR